MTTAQRNVCLGVILIIATFFRFYHFTTVPPGLYPDEAMNGNDAVQTAETNHFQVFYPNNNGREGLYIDILALFLKVLPISKPWIVRLPAAIAGVLTVWGIYLLVAELFGNGPGLLASFLLATSVWHIIFSRIGFRAILSPLLLIWALYLLIKALKSSSRGRGIALSIIAGGIYALGFYTYIAYRITPLLFLLFIPFFFRSKRFWLHAGLFIAATFIVAAPIGWYFYSTPGSFFGRTTEISVTSAPHPLHDLLLNIGKEALMFNWHGDYNWRQNISGAPELFWPVGILFIVGIILVLYAISSGTRDRSGIGNRGPWARFGLWLTVSWMIVGALPAVLSDEGIPHALRSILMIPPAILFAALGGVWLYHFIERRLTQRTAKVIASAFLILVTWYAYYGYFIAWGANPNVPGAFAANYVEIGNVIHALPSSTPKYVIVEAGGVPVNGIPMPAETTMFVTHSFTPQDRAVANIHYLLPDETSTIPSGTPPQQIFIIN